MKFSLEIDEMTIIAISGVTGAGKSTLSSVLAKELNATLITWDDFDEISTDPDDYVDWYQRGQKIMCLLKMMITRNRRSNSII